MYNQIKKKGLIDEGGSGKKRKILEKNTAESFNPLMHLHTTYVKAPLHINVGVA